MNQDTSVWLSSITVCFLFSIDNAYLLTNADRHAYL